MEEQIHSKIQLATEKREEIEKEMLEKLKEQVSCVIVVIIIRYWKCVLGYRIVVANWLVRKKRIVFLAEDNAKKREKLPLPASSQAVWAIEKEWVIHSILTFLIR